jgi:cell wall-associated NlpC family hydrolase
MCSLQVNPTGQQISQDFSNLIGTPYEKRDCWGIVVDFYKQVLNMELAPYYSEVPESRGMAQAMVYTARKDFNKVKEPIFGDIILIKMLGFESHIAVYLGEGKILHTQHKTGCIIDSLARWEKMVVGFYRPKIKAEDD